jgi:aminoglycoside phosphotransferase (APT) family kinase protein
MYIRSEETSLRLADWLAGTSIGPNVEVLNLTAAAGAGFSAETLFAQVEAIEDGRGRRESLVVRRQNEGGELFLNSDLNLQYRMMAELGAHPAIPVPELIGIEFDGTVLGAPFLVMRQAEGRIVQQSPNYNREGWVCDLPGERRGDVWRNALRVLAEIHELEWRQGFEFLDRPERGRPGLDQYLNWIEEWYLWARSDRPHPVTDRALDYLKRRRPREQRVSVLWGDPTPSNILFRNDLTVSAVIDWEMAALGPAEADVAWWLFFDDLFSTGMGVTRLEGLPDRLTSISWYELFAGRRLENMDYYDVLATFRMAIIGMRAVDRQIGLGRIPGTTTARTHAPIMRMLADKLGEPLPEVGRDFFEFMAALGMR